MIGKKQDLRGVAGGTPPGTEARSASERQGVGRDGDRPTKAGGRLSRADQHRIGGMLQRVYDDVVNEGVPDRFKILLDQLGSGDDRATQSQPFKDSSAGDQSPPKALPHGTKSE